MIMDAQLKDTLARDQARIANEVEQAKISLGELQQLVIEGLQSGYQLSVGDVERLLDQEQVVRVWSQVGNLTATATDTANLKARLEEWLADATEQVMSPGRSRSTSLVSTARMMAEEDGLKSVARIVSRILGHVGQ